MTVAETHLLHCSFCAKSQQRVRKLIAGPGVYICNDCIDLCNGIIDEELDLVGVRERVAVADRDLDLLEALRGASARTDALVEQLRAEGVPWEDIASALRSDDST